MVNEPSEDNPVNDAALMSARLMQLKSEDETLEEESYDRPPSRPTPPPVSRKKTMLKRLGMVCLAGIVFAVGYKAGKWRMSRDVNLPVAVVNGETISTDDLNHACQIVTGKVSLQNLIDQKLTIQFARKKGVLPTPQMVDSRVSAMTKQPNFFKQLKQSNQTLDDFKQTVLFQLAKTAIIDKGVEASNREIHQYYLQNSDPKNPQARFYHPELVTIAVIISKNQQDIQKAQKDLAAGVAFPTVVARYSQDVSKKNIGVLPALRRGAINAQKFPGLEKIVFERQPPVQLEPMNFGGNWWLIRVLNHTQELTDPYEKVMEICRSGVLFTKGVQANGTALKQEEADYLKNAKIEIRNPEYKDVLPPK